MSHKAELVLLSSGEVAFNVEDFSLKEGFRVELKSGEVSLEDWELLEEDDPRIALGDRLHLIKLEKELSEKEDRINSSKGILKQKVLSPEEKELEKKMAVKLAEEFYEKIGDSTILKTLAKPSEEELKLLNSLNPLKFSLTCKPFQPNFLILNFRIEEGKIWDRFQLVKNCNLEKCWTLEGPNISRFSNSGNPNPDLEKIEVTLELGVKLLEENYREGKGQKEFKIKIGNRPAWVFSKEEPSVEKLSETLKFNNVEGEIYKISTIENNNIYYFISEIKRLKSNSIEGLKTLIEANSVPKTLSEWRENKKGNFIFENYLIYQKEGGWKIKLGQSWRETVYSSAQEALNSLIS